MKKQKINYIWGIAIACIMLIESLVVFWEIRSLKVLPASYLAAAAAGLLIVDLIVYLLVRDFRKHVPFVIGILLCFGMSVVCVMAVFYVRDATSFYEEIASDKTATTSVGVYVKASSKMSKLEEMKPEQKLGILESQDRETTETALKDIQKRTGQTFQTKAYAGVDQGIQGLEKDEVQVFLCNEAFFDIVKEMDGNENIADRVKKMETLNVESAPEETEETPSAQTQETGKEKQADAKEEKKEKRSFKVFISGIDTRGEMTAKSLSDVNIIAEINPETRQILLVTTPRDYFVPLSISGGAQDKLTHAGIYGIDVCVDTMEMLYDTQIDYYFRINFGGFVKVIDALGGITVQSDYDFDSKNVRGYHFNKGANAVDGEAALVFSRERYSFNEGDRQRGKNQLAVIQGVVQKMMSVEMLTNFSDILDKVAGCFETNIPYDTLAALVKEQLADGGAWNIVGYSVTGSDSHQKPYSLSQSVYVMVPDQKTVDKAKSLMKKVEEGGILSQEDAA